MHKIQIFREPDDQEGDEESAKEQQDSNEAGSSTEEKSTNELVNANTFEIFTDDLLESMDEDEIIGSLQKEEEYLKTLTPNLNTLQDYEKKVQFLTFTVQRVLSKMYVLICILFAIYRRNNTSSVQPS